MKKNKIMVENFKEKLLTQLKNEYKHKSVGNKLIVNINDLIIDNHDNICVLYDYISTCCYNLFDDDINYLLYNKSGYVNICYFGGIDVFDITVQKWFDYMLSGNYIYVMDGYHNTDDEINSIRDLLIEKAKSDKRQEQLINKINSIKIDYEFLRNFPKTEKEPISKSIQKNI